VVERQLPERPDASKTPRHGSDRRLTAHATGPSRDDGKAPAAALRCGRRGQPAVRGYRLWHGRSGGSGQAHAQAEPISFTDTHGEADTDPDPHSDAHADPDTDPDTESDSDAQPNADSQCDAESNTNTDTHPNTDA